MRCFLSGLSIFLIASLSGPSIAATTGMCQDTAVVTLWNRSPWAVTKTEIIERNQIDFGYSTPSELPPLGGRVSDGNFLPDTTFWSITALDLAKTEAKVVFTLLSPDATRAKIIFEFGVSQSEWTPNSGKIAQGAAMLAIGVATEKVSTSVKGGLQIMHGLIGNKTSRGLFLRISDGSYVDTQNSNPSLQIIEDKHDRTIVNIGSLSVVILPCANNCPNAGWIVAFLSYQDLRNSNILYD